MKSSYVLLRKKTKLSKEERARRLKEYQKKWRENNRKKINEYNKKDYQEHIEERKKYGREYYRKNAEKFKEMQRRYSKKNREALRKKARIRYQTPEFKEKKRIYYLRNKDKYIPRSRAFRDQVLTIIEIEKNSTLKEMKEMEKARKDIFEILKISNKDLSTEEKRRDFAIGILEWFNKEEE